MKTEVYSWRLSPDLKTTLEREARRRKTPVSALLDLAVRELLDKTETNASDDEEQRHLRSAALNCIGAFAGHDPDRSTKVRAALRRRLRTKHEA
jgi:hypothetical protein